jgi:hypothetical protein
MPLPFNALPVAAANPPEMLTRAAFWEMVQDLGKTIAIVEEREPETGSLMNRLDGLLRELQMIIQIAEPPGRQSG